MSFGIFPDLIRSFSGLTLKKRAIFLISFSEGITLPASMYNTPQKLDSGI
jgi:hypothetical protein